METTKPCELYQFKVILRGVSPQIWRRIHVWEHYTLDQLHRVLQSVMGWENYHLYEFRIAGAKYREPHPENERKIRNAKKTSLRDLLPGIGAEFLYVYDFGDYWQHDLVLESILPPSAETVYPRCVAGERSGPPEDVGGNVGYAKYLQAMADPSHNEHEDMMTWRGPFDPEAFSIERINKQLQKKFRPVRKRSLSDSRASKAAVSPEAKELLEAILLLSNPPLPQQKRIRIAPNDKVPFELTERERELILEHTFADLVLTHPLPGGPPGGEGPIFRFTLDDLDELAGYVAAEANHTKNKKLRKELDQLVDRIEATLDSYTDEPIIN